jgi:hypothetical protein
MCQESATNCAVSQTKPRDVRSRVNPCRTAARSSASGGWTNARNLLRISAKSAFWALANDLLAHVPRIAHEQRAASFAGGDGQKLGPVRRAAHDTTENHDVHSADDVGRLEEVGQHEGASICHVRRAGELSAGPS